MLFFIVFSGKKNIDTVMIFCCWQYWFFKFSITFKFIIFFKYIPLNSWGDIGFCGSIMQQMAKGKPKVRNNRLRSEIFYKKRDRINMNNFDNGHALFRKLFKSLVPIFMYLDSQSISRFFFLAKMSRKFVGKTLYILNQKHKQQNPDILCKIILIEY